MTLSRSHACIRLSLLVPAALVAFAPGLRAQAPDAEPELGESPERYAQVKVLEGAASIRKGETEEELTLGTPVAEGDVVESRARGVLQLGDGTRLAFGPGTRFRVAALFADRSGVREVLIRLDYGRLRVRVGTQSEAKVRVDTASGTGTVADHADATFDLGRDATLRFRVHGGRTTFGNERGHALIRAGERLTVYSNQDSLDRLSDFNTYDEDDFDQWADPQLTSRRGPSASRVPAEIRYFADDLDSHGRWVYVEEVQDWCWSPAGVAADWRPYYDGRWAAYPGGMTWVSSEPWGYVTYHHGRWGWGASLGWYWIPGVYYSPAWVAWQNSGAYVGWAPLGYSNQPCHWGYGAWGGGRCWNVVNVNHINVINVHTRVYADPVVLRGFNQGGAGSGPWFRGRVIVTPNEFRNPNQFQQVVGQHELARTRMISYDRAAQAATGRTIIRRETVVVTSPGGRMENSAPRGFERDRPHLAERPILRDAPSGGQIRGNDARPRPEERQPARMEDRRPEPSRDAPRQESRPVQRLEVQPGFRPAPSQEAPRPEFRQPTRMEAPRPEAPRQDSRPTMRQEAPRQEAPRQESRPTMRQEAPRQEAPRQEAPRQESRPAAPSRGSERPGRAPERRDPS